MLQAELQNNSVSRSYFIWRTSDILEDCLLPIWWMLRCEKGNYFVLQAGRSTNYSVNGHKSEINNLSNFVNRFNSFLENDEIKWNNHPSFGRI